MVSDSAPQTADALEYFDRLTAERGLAIRRDAVLAPMTTLRVGGSADRLAEPRTRAELLAVLEAARRAGIACLVIGNGSDLVVADAGVRGLVIRNRAREVALDGDRLSADAGTPMALLVKRATAAGLSGLEWGIAVPGTLGGAVWANAGAHGGEIRDRLAAVETWSPDSGILATMTPAECAFGYRESRFKHDRLVVVGARLTLSADDPTAVGVRVDAFQAQRAATQPLAEQNAGSVFRNPEGDHAGRLIDAAGLKGLRVGTASVSTRHANFIVTDRDGRAADVRRLADLVRATVRDASGITLEYEIEFVGDWAADLTEGVS
ncbi:MAG TPA: UDP-N-acetylmuramate dehydrogenase [Candidatus Limnocylindria bacterium]|nr:UDP-N-acetylmuramate dehydrogenase [Candidatus Limnocylindria bacterium]